MTALRESRTALDSLRRDNADLVARRRQLDAEIAVLEATLERQTGRTLGVEG